MYRGLWLEVLHVGCDKKNVSIQDKGKYVNLRIVLKLTPCFAGLSLPPGLSLRVMPLFRVVEVLLDSDFRQDFRPSAPLV